MRNSADILLLGEREEELDALYEEVLVLVDPQVSPVIRAAFARMVAADIWVAERHVAPSAAHEKIRTAPTQSESRRQALAEEIERGKIRSLCLERADATLKAASGFARAGLRLARKAA
jgi:hypothetical protein